MELTGLRLIFKKDPAKTMYVNDLTSRGGPYGLSLPTHPSIQIQKEKEKKGGGGGMTGLQREVPYSIAL